MIIRAKYLLVNPRTVVENGAVEIRGNIISSSGRFNPARPGGSNKDRTLDFGEAIITPGLVNVHTHLEGPALYGGTPPPGEGKILPPQSYTEWAERVINIRLKMVPDDFKKTVQEGYETLIRNGITLAGDHTHISRCGSVHRRAKIRRVLFEEVVDFNPLTAERSLTEVIRHSRMVKSDHYQMLGVAPHSPYTVSAELYKRLFKFARSYSMPLSTHLSELKEEGEFLIKGTGKLRTYLKRVGRDNAYWRPPGTTAVRYMAKLDVLHPPAFFVHCNYLSHQDINILAQAGVCVVFCPNSHHYFGHRNHPFRKLLRKGVTIALGTDGLGSNEDLSILREMKFILDNYMGIKPTDLFRMGTLNGLKTLGIKKKLGELRPGYEADLAVFPLRRNISQPERIKQELISTAPKSLLTMVAGKIIYRA